MNPQPISGSSVGLLLVAFLFGSTESWSNSYSEIHKTFPDRFLGDKKKKRGKEMRQSSELHYAFVSRSEENSSVDPDGLVPGASSNFWPLPIAPRTEVAKLPCVPTMDSQGLLPPGAYIGGLGTTNRLCRVSIAINSHLLRKEDELEPARVVKQMQSYVEDGLTSFQLEAALSPGPLVSMAEEEVYNRFLRDTPGSVVRLSHLTVPLHLPSDPDTRVDYRYIRAAIASQMRRMGSPEAIDCVQLHYRKNSLYHVEAIDALHELTREGLIQSFSGRKLPTSIVRAAVSFGFSNICANQMDLNLMNSSALSFDQKRLAVPIQATAPLLSGFLTDKYTGRRDSIPMTSDLSQNAQWHLRNTLPLWAGGRSGSNVVGAWSKFQREFLPVLDEIAQKHRVPVSSVAIRWLLQLDNVESVVVATTLAESEDVFNHRYRRPLSRKRQYRDVFRFELDEDEMEILWGLSGGQPPDVDPLALDDGESTRDFEQKSGGLYLPRR